MDTSQQMGSEFHRCSLQENNMADIKSNKKSFMNLRRYFREYCEYTGIHGFKFIGEKRSRCEKILWIIIFCLSLVTCICIVREVFKKWNQSPVIVNFASEHVNIFDITFPAVTICPETKVYGDYFNYSYSLRMYNNATISENKLKKLQYMSLLCNFNLYFDKIRKIDFIDKGFYDFLKKGTPAFLGKCIWMGNEFPCDEIFQPLITDDGLCQTFNMISKKELYTSEVENIEEPPKSYKNLKADDWSADFGYSSNAGVKAYPRRALFSGSTYSLEVTFVINNTDLDYGCTHFQGYKVVLHSSHRFPTVNSHYFRIPLKKSVSAAITPGMLKTSDDVAQYNIEKRKCFFQTDMKLKYFSQYSQINCRTECLLNLTLDTCGCVQYFMPRKKGMPVCGTGKYECVQNATALQAFLFLKGNLDERIRKQEKERLRKTFKMFVSNLTSDHFCHCPAMCNDLNYNVEITESDFDWPRKMASLGIDVVTEDVEGMSSSQLQIYFKGHTFIPQQRNELYGTFDFLANIGGLLGLFIGFSILSMVELIYFLSLRIICNVKLYKTWYGKPEGKLRAARVESITVMK